MYTFLYKPTGRTVTVKASSAQDALLRLLAIAGGLGLPRLWVRV